MEFERKFRLAQLPVDVGPSIMVRQVYWQLGNGWVMRLRRVGDSTRLDDEVALKGPRDHNGRQELEWRLRDAKKTQSSAELIRAAIELFSAGSAHQVVKTRHSYMWSDGETYDIDEFHHANQGLIVAELEKTTTAELAAVAVPEFAMEEVSGDPRYQNEHLAFNAWPTWQ